MIVGEGGADGFCGFEAAVFGEKPDFGRGEGVVLRQFQHAVIEPLCEVFLEAEQAEVEVEGVVACDQGLLVRLLQQRLFFLLQTQLCNFFIHLTNYNTIPTPPSLTLQPLLTHAIPRTLHPESSCGRSSRSVDNYFSTYALKYNYY